jgi:hypothetical protein
LTGENGFKKGCHLILNEKEIAKLHNLIPKDQNSEIHAYLKLSALLWAYSDSLYFQGREICCEYHGLYTCSGGNNIMVRDFTNFSPKDLWPELSFDNSYSNIRIITLHNKSLEIFVDAYNNISVVKGGFATSLLNGAAFVNNEKVDLEKVGSMIMEFSDKLTLQTDYVNSIHEWDLGEKYVEIFWYRKRRLSDFLGEFWKPRNEVYERFNSANIIQTPENPYGQKSIQLLRQQYDYSSFFAFAEERGAKL